MNLYGTRLHAILLSIGFLVYSGISNLPAIFARTYDLDPSGKSICTYDYTLYPTWEYADIVFSYINIIVPCSAHLICSACILTAIARRKILIHRNNHPKQRIYCVWLRQLYIHRDFLIPPMFLIICLLPNAIHGHLLDRCVSYSSVIHLRVIIAFTFLLYIPLVFVYIVYIYPNDSYRKEFRQTWFYKTLCCLYRRDRPRLQQRHQLTVTKVNTLSELEEDSHL